MTNERTFKIPPPSGVTAEEWAKQAAGCVGDYRPLPERLAEKQRNDLVKALEAIEIILDGRQPIDVPGAVMVARTAIAKAKEKR